MDEYHVSEFIAAFMAVFYTIIVSFGGITNFLVLSAHVKYHKILLKNSTDILIFSLACGDFVMSFLVSPLPLASAIAHKWTTGRSGCNIYGLMITWIGLSSILQLSCIAIERYHTLSRMSISTTGARKRAILMIAACWFSSFAASLLPLFGFSEFTLEGYGLHCSIIWSKTHVWYCMFLLVFFFVMPVVTIALSYTKMFLVVHKIYRKAEVTWGPNSQVTRKSYGAQLKFTKQLMIVTCGFLLAWTPYAIMSSLRVLTDIEFSHASYELPAVFAKTSNIYNPIIYFIMYRRLRRHISLFLGDAKKSITSFSF